MRARAIARWLALPLLSQLTAMAEAPGDESARTAAERLIQAKARNCGAKAGPGTVWHEGQSVRIESQYFFAHEMEQSRRDEVIRAGDEYVASALRALGGKTGGENATVTIEMIVLGSAKAWLFGEVALDGPMRGSNSGVDQVMYPDADWKGVLTIHAGGRCVCAETFHSEAQRRSLMVGTGRRKPSEAPFRRDLRNALAPVLVRIGKDLYGEAAVRALATVADAVQIRQEALAQLRDPAALAEIIQNDSSDLMRWIAVGKVSNQTVLAAAALRDKSPLVRLAAVRRLSDTAALGEVARGDPDADVRKLAQARLGRTR